MNKTFYIIIALVLSVNVWDLKVLDVFFNSTTIPVLALLWMMFGWLYFSNQKVYAGELNLGRYNRYFYWLSFGFALSFLTAYLFWNQDILTSVIVNRRLVFYLFIPVFFHIQPSERDIIKSLSYFTVLYLSVWLYQVVTPYPVTTSMEVAIEAGRGTFDRGSTDFGYLMPGYTLLLIPVYYRIQKLIEDVSLRTILPVILMTGFLFLLQNRGTLFFAIVVLLFAFFRIRTKYRYFFIIFFIAVTAGAYIVTEKYWLSFFNETSQQLSDPEYNRWKSLYYFLFHYSPHWLCYLFGNGYLSSRIDSGQFLIVLMNAGFYQADLGIIGLWSMYGMIPVLVIYAIVYRLLFIISAPFYMKALAAHVLVVPICWGFSYYDMLLLVLMSYLAGYYSETLKTPELKLQYSV